MKFSRQIFALALVFTLSIGIFSQTKTESNKENKSSKKTDRTVSVKANVLILGADGKPSSDVKAEDLKIYEDGVEQKNVSLTEISSVNIGVVVDNTGSVQRQFKELTAMTAFIPIGLIPRQLAAALYCYE